MVSTFRSGVVSSSEFRVLYSCCLFESFLPSRTGFLEHVFNFFYIVNLFSSPCRAVESLSHLLSETIWQQWQVSVVYICYGVRRICRGGWPVDGGPMVQCPCDTFFEPMLTDSVYTIMAHRCRSKVAQAAFSILWFTMTC